MRESHYENKSLGYGIGHTRLRKILKLVGPVKDLQILDVGCSRGYLGQRLKALGNKVIGVEISHLAAEQARQVLDEVHSFDIEKAWPETLLTQSFDLVILAEVAEHVFDPVEVPKNVSLILRSGGQIILTTPNFMTWTNRLRFIVGDFRYQNEGMFDFGHIRFFTYTYLKTVLREAGFELVQEEHIFFPGKLTSIIKYWPGVFAWQFIIKAKLV